MVKSILVACSFISRLLSSLLYISIFSLVAQRHSRFYVDGYSGAEGTPRAMFPVRYLADPTYLSVFGHISSFPCIRGKWSGRVTVSGPNCVAPDSKHSSSVFYVAASFRAWSAVLHLLNTHWVSTELLFKMGEAASFRILHILYSHPQAERMLRQILPSWVFRFLFYLTKEEKDQGWNETSYSPQPP